MDYWSEIDRKIKTTEKLQRIENLKKQKEFSKNKKHVHPIKVKGK